MTNVNNTTNDADKVSDTNVIEFRPLNKKENKIRNERHKTLKFNLFYDKDKEVVLNLSDANMTLLYQVFKFEDEEELYNWLLEDMQAEFSANTYENFEQLKFDFENNIDEILDEGAKLYALYQQIYPLHQQIISKIRWYFLLKGFSQKNRK